MKCWYINLLSNVGLLASETLQATINKLSLDKDFHGGHLHSLNVSKKTTNFYSEYKSNQEKEGTALWSFLSFKEHSFLRRFYMSLKNCNCKRVQNIYLRHFHTPSWEGSLSQWTCYFLSPNLTRTNYIYSIVQWNTNYKNTTFKISSSISLVTSRKGQWPYISHGYS
jgi:hypothetical protein